MASSGSRWTQMIRHKSTQVDDQHSSLLRSSQSRHTLSAPLFSHSLLSSSFSPLTFLQWKSDPMPYMRVGIWCCTHAEFVKQTVSVTLTECRSVAEMIVTSIYSAKSNQECCCYISNRSWRWKMCFSSPFLKSKCHSIWLCKAQETAAMKILLNLGFPERRGMNCPSKLMEPVSGAHTVCTETFKQA